MSKLPQKLRQELIELVYARADEHGYLRRNRVDNGLFLQELVRDSRIGGRLAEFMPREKVRTYIKDGILNRYSKERNQLPRDVRETLKRKYGQREVHEIDYNKSTGVSLHRTDSGSLVVVARANYVKWETAVRRMLLYSASLPAFKENPQTRPELVIIVFPGGIYVPLPDRKILELGLSYAGITCLWGESLTTYGAV